MIDDELAAETGRTDRTATIPAESKDTDVPSGNSRLYAASALGLFLVATVVFLAARPHEITNPPLNNGASGAPAADPHAGHDHESPHPEAAGQLEALERHVASGKGTPQEVLLLANLLYDRGERTKDPTVFERAASHYRAYLISDPENPNARTDYAYAIFRTGDLDQAVAELRSVRIADPKHQNSAFNLAMMYKEKDRPDSVLHYLKLTAEIDETSPVGIQAVAVLEAYRDSHDD